jgi:hypothetical protein
VKVPAPWRLGTPPVLEDALLRFKLSWVRDGDPRVVGVIMYNPAREGEQLGDGIRDGATHRRVRHLLRDFTEIRVANLSPHRSTKPRETSSWESVIDKVPSLLSQGLLARDLDGEDLEQQRLSAIRWACEAPVVVVAWGAGYLWKTMKAARAEAIRAGYGRLFCWGATMAGEPWHPSPLNLRLTRDATLETWRPR